MSDRPNRVSLNTDIGEGFGAWTMADDDALLAIVTDANIACGFHAGDPSIMRRTCETAVANGVAIGAHVGFHDLRGFGRRYIAVSQQQLLDDVMYQIGALAGFAKAAGSKVQYVKPHGALYHSAVAHDEHAAAVVGAICQFDLDLPLLCQPGTNLARRAVEVGLTVLCEGFIDRAYAADGALVPRSESGAVIEDPIEAVGQAIALVTTGSVTTRGGTKIPMSVDSLCVHSDSPGAAEFVGETRTALESAGVAIAPLTAVEGTR